MFTCSRNPKTDYYEVGPLVNRTFIVEGGKGRGEWITFHTGGKSCFTISSSTLYIFRDF